MPRGRGTFAVAVMVANSISAYVLPFLALLLSCFCATQSARQSQVFSNPNHHMLVLKLRLKCNLDVVPQKSSPPKTSSKYLTPMAFFQFA
jgi:hypothetical protein